MKKLRWFILGQAAITIMAALSPFISPYSPMVYRDGDYYNASGLLVGALFQLVIFIVLGILNKKKP